MELGQWVDGDLYNGRTVRVANSFVFKEPVFNYSAEFPFLWDEIRLPIKYGCDHRVVRAMLSATAKEVVGDFPARASEHWAAMVRGFRLEDASVEPMVTMTGNDNWLEFTVRYVVDYKARRTTKDRLWSRIIDEIEASQGRIAIASATFQLVEAAPLDVRLHRALPVRS
jgi:small-conductance mechanosensitive channel